MASPNFEGKCTECAGWHGPTLQFGRVVDSDTGVGLAQELTMWFWCSAKLAKFRPTDMRRRRHA